ncbi:MAG: copper-binding protein [Comamonas sp.]
MHRFKQWLSVAALALGAALPLGSLAQAAAEPGQAAAAPQASWTDGEIKKLDLDNGKATIKHGEIKNLDMPGMTMVFTARDKGLLTNLKPGDKVRFVVVQEAGKMVLTDIQPVP